MIFTETFEHDDDEVCYDIDVLAVLSTIEPPEKHMYKYDNEEYEDLDERDEFLEYCIQTLCQEDEVME